MVKCAYCDIVISPYRSYRVNGRWYCADCWDKIIPTAGHLFAAVRGARLPDRDIWRFKPRPGEIGYVPPDWGGWADGSDRDWFRSLDVDSGDD